MSIIYIIYVHERMYYKVLITLERSSDSQTIINLFSLNVVYVGFSWVH
jgi:hypothetical protein